MTIWFVSRHPGAMDWMKRSQLHYDVHATHLDIDQIQSGDKVIGSLPVNLAASVCSVGAEYWHLSLNINPNDRGKELTSSQLFGYGATLEQFEIRKPT